METLLSQAPILVLADTSVNNNISGSVSSQDVEHSILKRNIRLELNSFDISKEALMQSVTMTFLTMSIKKFKEDSFNISLIITVVGGVTGGGGDDGW
ncbi:hypothetical protein G6F36_014266 [Rhizopus arrhizus]|nr:hypothetical protein G6F36_014266 [Rhizopus arrhizus]